MFFFCLFVYYTTDRDAETNEITKNYMHTMYRLYSVSFSTDCSIKYDLFFPQKDYMHMLCIDMAGRTGHTGGIPVQHTF